MSHLVNDVDSAVQDSVDGLVRASGGKLARLDGYPDIKVVVRTDWTRDRVAVVSGGGAGHEPAHAGFVGQGMLTAAVCGEIFASPSVDAVLAAILAVTGEPGCLVIVKNYTGDRLNFGLAVERARALGRSVEMVVVGDDVALPGAPQPRGLAGTLFVHKSAGALAESGASLEQVHAVAARVASGVKTLGVSLTGVAIPGRPYTERVETGTAELGLGIHGEPGAQTVQLGDAATLVSSIADSVGAGVGDGPVALLLNNLGGVASLELGIVLRDLLGTALGSRAELLTGPAPLMTSLSAQGFSVSALPIDEELSGLLRAPVAPHLAWPGALPVGGLTVADLPSIETPSFTPSSDPAVRDLLTAVSQAVIDAEETLNTLDSYVGDGDTGSTFATAAHRVLAVLDDLPLAERPALFSALSGILATSMGGSSGVLGSVFFAAAGSASAEGVSVARALRAGIDAMQTYGGAAEGDRTMLDALIPAVAVLLEGGSPADAAQAAEAAAVRTASMTSARAGRSAYVPAEHLADVQDPGAAAVSVMFAAAARS
ncbi:dihydroxyacetone kinase subunit DhaK [Kineosporia sp. J2-2]|uniref:Dihydroxyacetone kinase subunit DhaK n=1 Tax=Kineosporia corallincola TaxID=2835133 RepID=A0ABS5TDZ2_9ACTN|nr:dihydroxyacetone kinase subunit DhaK [Kineosporia corallincola]MBT0769270.1 dihydroxyacetone kinase subunit DhaK [Kineosporia corallincola]